MPHAPAGPGGHIEEFRVCEKLDAFYLLTCAGPLRCVGFDGNTRWTFQANVGWGDGLTSGGFEVDDDGILYAIEPRGGEEKVS